MANEFDPTLSILPAEQRRLWDELGDLRDTFVLCGGTAIALQLGHRSSVDFDFISSVSFDPDELYASTPFLKDSQPVQKSPNNLTCVVDRGGKVQVSFFGTPAVHLVFPPLVARGNRMHVASLTDLAGMKAAVVQKRAEAKDYLDLDAIIGRGAVDLSTALAAAKSIYGRSFNPELTLKALCFFGNGDLPTLSAAIQGRLAAAAGAVDLSNLPNMPTAHNSR